MRRFDLLDEYTCVAVPRFSSAPARPVREPEASPARSHWRYGLAGGFAAILLIALVAF